MGGPGGKRCIKSGSAFYLGTACGYANHDFRLKKLKSTRNLTNEVFKHGLGYLIIGNYPVTHRTAGYESLRGSSQHSFSLFSNCYNLIILGRNRNYSRLIYD